MSVCTHVKSYLQQGGCKQIVLFKHKALSTQIIYFPPKSLELWLGQLSSMRFGQRSAPSFSDSSGPSFSDGLAPSFPEAWDCVSDCSSPCVSESFSDGLAPSFSEAWDRVSDCSASCVLDSSAPSYSHGLAPFFSEAWVRIFDSSAPCISDSSWWREGDQHSKYPHTLWLPVNMKIGIVPLVEILSQSWALVGCFCCPLRGADSPIS